MGVRGLTSMPDVMDMMWFLAVVGFSIAFMWFYTATVVEPLYNALQCTCLSEGDTCREAHTFSKDFWDQYWSKAVPSAIQSIMDMKLQFETGAVNFQRHFWRASNHHTFPKYHHLSQFG